MTIAQLRDLLDAKRVPSSLYSLRGGDANDTLCIAQQHGRWCVYYTERGMESDYQLFDYESDACDEFIRRALFSGWWK